MAGSQAESVLRHLHRLLKSRGVASGDRQLLERFVARRDEDAFAELVARHGPLVYGVCRRVLRDAHDAEDVFQATFLILARKAASIRKPESLSCFLHGVAYRLAIKAKTEADKRRAHERRAAPLHETEEIDLTWREVRSLIDEELQRLPEKQRLPLVLCYLEGLTQDEAARRLGWPRGTLKRRLEGGRERLRIRLTRRGVALGAGLFAVVLTERATKGAVPLILRESTVRAGVQFTTNAVTVTRAALLAKGALQTMLTTKLKVGAMVMLMLGCVATAAGLATRGGPAAKPSENKAEAPTQPRSAENKQVRKDRYGDPLPEVAIARLAAEAKESHDWGARPVRKDAYGDPLPEKTIARLGTNRLRKDEGTASVAYSSDGKWIASADNRGAVRIWNAANGEEIALAYPPVYPDELVTKQWVLFSPDGRNLIYSTPRGLQAWEVATRRSSPLPIDAKPFAFSPDGKLLAGIEKGEKFTVFDFKKRSVRSHPCPDKNYRAITFSPDGKLIAIGGEGNTPSTAIIRLWDVAADKEIAKLESRQGWIESLDFSPDSKVLASGGHYSFCLWDLATLKRVASVAFTTSIVSFSPDGKLLAVANSSDTVRLWNIRRVRDLSTTLREAGGSDTIPTRMVDSVRHEKVGSIQTGNGGTTALAFSPDRKRLLIGGCDHALRLWDMETGEEVLAKAGHRHPIHSVQFSPDGETLASRGEDLSILLWDLTTGKARQLFSWGGEDRRRAPRINYMAPNTLAYAPDGKTIAAITADYDLWDAKSGHKILTINKPKHHSSSIAFTPDGQVLGAVDDSVCMWSASSGAELQSSLTGGSELVAFSPDGRTLAMRGLGLRKSPASDSLISLWDWRRNRFLREFRPQKGWPCCLAFSFDGQLLATCGGHRRQKDSLVHLWETATGGCFRTLDHKETNLLCVALSPDGRLLASGGEGDQALHIWDILTGKELAQFKGHHGNIYSVAFSPDGKLLASGSADTTILLWDVSGLQSKPSVTKDTPEEFNRLWAEMNGRVATAYQAMWTLSGAGDKAVAFLKQQLRPVPLPDTKQLIADLDSDEFHKREAATKQLAQLGEYAKPAMRKALQAKPTLEARKRLNDLLARTSPLPSSERDLRQTRALHALELIGSPAARDLLKKLADGAPGAALTRDAKLALQRLERRAPKPVPSTKSWQLFGR